MESGNNRQWWLWVLVSSIVPLCVVLGSLWEIPQRFTIPLILFAMLVSGSMLIWLRANSRRNVKDAWWQDDSASGWRGY